MATFKRATPERLLQGPHPHDEPLLTHGSTGDPLTLQLGLVQSPTGSLLLSLGAWCAQILFVLSKSGVSVSPILRKSYSQILLAFKVRRPGDS